jgi:hypothetical protein
MINNKPYYVGFPRGIVVHVLKPRTGRRDKLRKVIISTFCGREFPASTWFEDGFDNIGHAKPRLAVCLSCKKGIERGEKAN